VAATSAAARLAARLARTSRALLARAASRRVRLPYAAAAHLLGLLGGLLAAGGARAVELPEDRADLMYHHFEGGDRDRAYGPALLVRKRLGDTVSLSGLYYMDIVSGASIDVVTTASPFKETRNEGALALDYVYRDASIALSYTTSKEPDYLAKSANIDVAQEVFGGMTTVSLGYTRAWDKVGRKDEGYFDSAKHWRYRFGLTQILTPRWMASANFEAVSDDGFLGSAYRAARVFGALVPERNPRTRTSRAVTLRAIGDLGSRDSGRAEYRYFWDTWDISAHTLEFGYSRYFGDRWLGDGYLRYYKQDRALFYSDNATTETTYISRNRQLSTFDSYALGAKAAYTLKRVPGRYEIRLNGALERLLFKYRDFTDVRDGSKYSQDVTVLQMSVSATF
jgi:hypothetical protein